MTARCRRRRPIRPDRAGSGDADLYARKSAPAAFRSSGHRLSDDLSALARFEAELVRSERTGPPPWGRSHSQCLTTSLLSRAGPAPRPWRVHPFARRSCQDIGRRPTGRSFAPDQFQLPTTATACALLRTPGSRAATPLPRGAARSGSGSKQGAGGLLLLLDSANAFQPNSVSRNWRVGLARSTSTR